MRASSDLRGEINVTPLVDVVLVLLIIFMVAVPLIQGYGVDLPPSKPPEAPPDDDQIVVSVLSDGSVLLNKEPVTRENLSIRLQEALSGRLRRTVFFAAADSVNYGDALAVMDVIRSAGTTRIGIALDEGDSPAPVAPSPPEGKGG
jgi:biopolymer transport protein ExbD